MVDWAIQARGLGKAYRLYTRPIDRLRELVSPTRKSYHQEVWALRDLDIEIGRGTVTGLIGANGAGKSTFLKLVAGKLAPTRGTLEARGRISSILELGTGFQPHLTGRQNAFVNALFLGQRPWEAEARLDQLLAFADLPQGYEDQPLSAYSSGMQARLAFAVLTTLDPEILVLDEALATGDAGFAEKCKTFLRGLCRSGCTTIVASHDYVFVTETCDRVIWIDHGKVRDDGEPVKVVHSYLDHLGCHDDDPTPRPRHALVRIDREDSAIDHAFLFHLLEWIGPGGESLGAFHLGDDQLWNELCVGAATQMGFAPASARAGWGPGQNLGTQVGWGLCRACRPALGPGGQAYLALPLPAAPRPLPAKLRVAMLQCEQPTSAVISIQVNGRFCELGRLRRCEDPWRRVDLDVSAAFVDDGRAAPPLDEATVKARGLMEARS